jgi:hypothetical protein
MGVNTISWSLARIGRQEQHPAVAKLVMSHVQDHRDPAQQDRFAASQAGRLLRTQAERRWLKLSRRHDPQSPAAKLFDHPNQRQPSRIVLISN